jgi:O-antigen ligase
MYQKMTPSATEEYAIYHDPVATVEAPVTAAPGPERQRMRRSKGPQFYMPFHYILLAYLFLYCSRLAEMIPYLHIGMVIQPILLIGMIMTGTVKSIFENSIGKYMVAFTIWVAICVPFSIWRGGSFPVFLTALQALGLLFFMAAFIRTIPDCFRVMFTVALAMAAVGVLSIVVGGGKIHDTRLGLGTGGDTLADANFLALYLIVGLPFLWFSASIKTGIVKVGLFLMMIPVLAGMARTGSRMGLLGLAAGMILFFLHATARQRASIIIGGTIFLILAVFFLPHKITERFTTFFEPSSAASAEAAESAEARKRLLLRSIELSIEHPFFGVGPGVFQVGEAAQAAAEGKRALWHFTHNSYTELSSETGVTGLVLFLMALYRSYKGMTPIRDRYRTSVVRRAALFLQIAILMSAIGAFFLSIAYGGLLYAILGLSAAFQVAVRNETRQTRMQAREALPS